MLYPSSPLHDVDANQTVTRFGKEWKSIGEGNELGKYGNMDKQQHLEEERRKSSLYM